MLDRAPGKTMADLKRALPKTYHSPTMSPHCDDEKKYGIVDEVVADYQELAGDGGTIAGQKIRDLVTVNGVRVTLEDGTWGLVRASSNKPELVVVVESPVSEANMKAIFADIDRAAVAASRSRRVQSEDRRLRRAARQSSRSIRKRIEMLARKAAKHSSSVRRGMR